MTILDADLEFSDAQSQAASSGTVTQSTNVRDLYDGSSTNPQKNGWGSAKLPQLGGLTWNCNVSTTVNASTVITAKLMSHTGIASIASGNEVAQIVFPAASAAGTRKAIEFPTGTEITSGDRYIGVTYTVSGAKCTAGAINSWIGLDNEKHD